MMKKLLTVLATLLCLLLVGGGGWWAWHSSHPAPLPVAPTVPHGKISAPATVRPHGPLQAKVDTSVDELSEQEAEASTEEGAIGVNQSDPQAGEGPSSTIPVPTLKDPHFTTVAPTSLKPHRLFIPCINSYSRIQEAPVRRGELVLNSNPSIVTHWTGGAGLTGGEGSILMAGHVTYNRTLGSLYHLSDLTPGCLAYASDGVGKIHSFKLVSLEEFKKANLPLSLWETYGPRRLTLVTCGGPVVYTSHGRIYRDNVVATFLPLS